MRARNALLTVVVAGLALVGQQTVQASDRNAAIAGLAVGAVVGGAIASQHSRSVQVYAPPPAYYPPPQVVYYPPPAAYYPPPVYYQPQPIYYQPRPVYYRPAPVYSRPYYGLRYERWQGRDGGRW